MNTTNDNQYLEIVNPRAEDLAAYLREHMYPLSALAALMHYWIDEWLNKHRVALDRSNSRPEDLAAYLRKHMSDFPPLKAFMEVWINEWLKEHCG